MNLTRELLHSPAEGLLTEVVMLLFQCSLPDPVLNEVHQTPIAAPLGLIAVTTTAAVAETTLQF